jgi:hypothetical protein
VYWRLWRGRRGLRACRVRSVKERGCKIPCVGLFDIFTFYLLEHKWGCFPALRL